ncbi:MAG: VOC family protein [Candidatus Babeliales bacterium]
MIKPKLGFILLFVENPAISAAFYSKLFNTKPIEQSPTFAMFALTNGVMLGLWSRYTAEPIVSNEPGAAEICFAVENVDAAFDVLGAQGITMIQKPTDMDFGRTFVALDPDGHRIRIYKLMGE